MQSVEGSKCRWVSVRTLLFFFSGKTKKKASRRGINRIAIWQVCGASLQVLGHVQVMLGVCVCVGVCGSFNVRPSSSYRVYCGEKRVVWNELFRGADGPRVSPVIR